MARTRRKKKVRRGARWLIALSLVCLAAGAAFLFWNPPSTVWASGYPFQGIDVSHHQGSIDWPRVAKAKVGFAYIKATEGSDWVDPMFDRNWQGAQAAGIPRGAYHYYRLDTPWSGQFANLSATVPVEEDALPMALDLEFWGNSPLRPPALQVRSDLESLVEAIRTRYGKAPLLYASYEFFDTYLRGTSFGQLWVPDYTTPPRGDLGDRWTLWQYTDKGKVDGILTLVDLNVSASDPLTLGLK